MHTKNEGFCISTPTTDRGVTNTYIQLFDLDISSQTLVLMSEVIIDWFQVTIFPKKGHKFLTQNLVNDDYVTNDRIIPTLFYELFGIYGNDIIREEKGFNGYDIRYSYKGIDIMTNSQRSDMGINILLKGCGCRDFEDLNIGWNTLFDKLMQFDINFNRIDIAIDTFDKRYFNIELLKRYIKGGLCISKFKKSLNLCSRILKNGEISSNTLQFGSKASDIEITFYDKYLERENAGKEISKEIDFWVRTEIRFRHEKAEDIFKLIYNQENYMGTIKSILYNYIDFKTPYSNDSNISRRETVKWWSYFLEDCSKLKLSSRSSERRITKIHNWLLNMTSKSNFMVYLSELHTTNLDNISIDLMYELILKGSENIKDKDLQIINDYRISKKMQPLTKSDIYEYVEKIKENILI